MRAKGEGSVYQRKDGRWVATLYDDHGQRRALYGRTERDVLARRRKAQREGMPAGRPITLAVWLDQWVAGLATRPLRRSTTDDYASKARRITQALGRHRLDRLTAAHIEHAYAGWLAEGLSPGMVKNLHRVLHASLQTAWRRDVIVKNPASLVEPPAPRPKPGVALTVDQARTVLAEAARRPAGVRWWLALLLGMRQGEVLGLRWEHIDLDGGALVVVRENAKSASSARVLPLAPVLVSMLADLPRDSDFVFPGRTGGRRDSKADWNEWQLLLEYCHLPRIRVHDCRHTTPTLLLELGVPARVVSEILGHATVGMTLNVYTHVPDPMLRAALHQLTARLTA